LNLDIDFAIIIGLFGFGIGAIYTGYIMIKGFKELFLKKN
jgi:hypothetical protein